jgi:hypothetical protein
MIKYQHALDDIVSCIVVYTGKRCYVRGSLVESIAPAFLEPL